MSDARVQFLDLASEPVTTARPQRFGFACPKHKGRRCEGLLIAGAGHGIKRDGKGKNGRPQWEWDGNREQPTFKPSINCGGCWHGFIEAGRCVDVQHRDEPAPA